MKWEHIYGRPAVPHLGKFTSNYNQTATCKDCGAGVYLCEQPAPNGIRIGGSAVAVNCTKLNTIQ